MRNPPSSDELRDIPPLRSTINVIIKNKKVYDEYWLKRFIFTDKSKELYSVEKIWSVVEYSPESRIFYGFVGDRNVEGKWEYFSLDDLLHLRNKRGTAVRRLRRDYFYGGNCPPPAYETRIGSSYRAMNLSMEKNDDRLEKL